MVYSGKNNKFLKSILLDISDNVLTTPQKHFTKIPKKFRKSLIIVFGKFLILKIKNKIVTLDMLVEGSFGTTAKTSLKKVQNYVAQSPKKQERKESWRHIFPQNVLLDDQRTSSKTFLKIYAKSLTIFWLKSWK